MRKKAMICQPMNGRSKTEILAERDRVIKILDGWGYDVVDTFFDFNHNDLISKGVVCIPLYYLAESILKMSECHAVYFCKGYEDYRGCCVEHYMAEKYGLELMYGKQVL